MPLFLSASSNKKHPGAHTAGGLFPFAQNLRDTTKTKKQEQDDKKKIKEVAKAKKQPKPEKLGTTPPPKPKAKRERRPDGMERPPEIPRRNGN